MTSPSLPVVTIVGRPNVGKSALFNRVVRRRLAIVDPKSGVTRDVIERAATWEKSSWLLRDTAGMTFDSPGAQCLEADIQKQTRRAVEDSDFLILAVDAQEGLTPLDMLVYELLVRSGKPFCVALNKVDNETLKQNAGEFARLGAAPQFLVSALHGTGLYGLLDCVAASVRSAPPEPETPELPITIVGKPNVGKSSFFNRLLGQDRVLVDDKPGTTRDSIDTHLVCRGIPVLLVDTAGMRRERRAADTVEQYSMMRTQESIRRAQVVLVMLDATQGVTQQDRRILKLVTDQLKGCVIAVNKWDLVSGSTMTAFKTRVKDMLGSFQYVPVLFLSAKTGLNVKKCLETLLDVSRQYRETVPTPRLNKLVRRLVEQFPPPIVSGRRLKIYYVVQIDHAPPVIEFFINSRKSVLESYMRFVVNELRNEYAFSGVPIKLVYREKTRGAARARDPEAKDRAAGVFPHNRACEEPAEELPPASRRARTPGPKGKKSFTPRRRPSGR